MNPLTNVKNINKLNEIEAELGLTGGKTSWHQQYKDSAYIFIGGLPFDLTEGDIICVFSQYGEIMNINLVRDKKSGKSKGYCFLAYEDQRSTILAVDNLNGIKILGRTIRVDHVSNYRKPKEDDNDDEITQMLRKEGCAPKTPSPPASEDEDTPMIPQKKPKKDRKSKSHDKKKKKKKHKKNPSKQVDSSDSNSDHTDQGQGSPVPIRVKQEVDRGYEAQQQKKRPIQHDDRNFRDEMQQREDEERRGRRTEGSQVNKHRQDDRGRFQDSSIAEGRGDRWNEKNLYKRETQKYHGGRVRDRGGDREMDRDRSRNRESRQEDETHRGKSQQSSDQGSGREAKWEARGETERDRYRGSDETYGERQRDKHRERDRSDERQERYSHREPERKSYKSGGARRDDSRR
ncbi:uncharacterized protein [Asterias amurensis]|uniref:uncharacterized protein n=1 Tax=Asterias amurensis TaxID=7602 RepID=UPI003AB11F89